jgi:hypothetical protein
MTSDPTKDAERLVETEEIVRALNEAVVEAAMEWRDEHAFEPPPEDGRDGWVAERLAKRMATSDKLKAALATRDAAIEARQGE